MIKTIIFCEKETDIQTLEGLQKIRRDLKILSLYSFLISFDDAVKNSIIFFVLDRFRSDIFSDIHISNKIHRDIIIIADYQRTAFIPEQLIFRAEHVQKSGQLLSQTLYLIRMSTIKVIEEITSNRLIHNLQIIGETAQPTSDKKQSQEMHEHFDNLYDFNQLIENWLCIGSSGFEKMNFSDVMDRSFALFESLISERIEIEKQIQQIGMIYCDVSLMNKAITSLFLKIIGLSSTFKKFVFATALHEGLPGIQESLLSLKISLDDSVRLPEDRDFYEHIQNLIESDFSAQLSIAFHYGEICSSPHSAENVILEILLPCLSSFKQSETAKSISAGKKIKTILVVDDEEIIRELIVDVLPDSEYRVLTAADGKEGLDVFKSYNDEIDLVILDVVMPKMDGRELYDAIREINQHVKVVITSGYSKANVRNKLALSGVSAFFPKPFVIGDLEQLLKKLLV